MALVRATQQTSSSNTSRYCRYHVFLSFRGEDTRKTFTDHLFTALVNAGFRTFRDDDELERGEDIKPELQKAIKHSRTSVIVFSKDYASSRWCLDELMMILGRKRTSPDYVVLPVFYDVDPSHVRNQTGSLARAFARHQKSQHPEKVKAWKDALAEVADLAGMVLQNQADGGQDTRKTFTDHLYTALVNAGFRTFRDDDEVERGEGIKPELQKAIKHSRTSVIVFSKDYASSTWCLDELVLIREISISICSFNFRRF